jgi:hypothetical protein
VHSADGPRLERIYIHQIDPNPTPDSHPSDSLIQPPETSGLDLDDSPPQPASQDQSIPLSPELIAELTGVAFESQVSTESHAAELPEEAVNATPIGSIAQAEIVMSSTEDNSHSEAEVLRDRAIAPETPTPRSSVSEQAIHELRDATLLDSPLASVPLDWQRDHNLPPEIDSVDR